jgi:hypothetical protein
MWFAIYTLGQQPKYRFFKTYHEARVWIEKKLDKYIRPTLMEKTFNFYDEVIRQEQMNLYDDDKLYYAKYYMDNDAHFNIVNCEDPHEL